MDKPLTLDQLTQRGGPPDLPSEIDGEPVVYDVVALLAAEITGDWSLVEPIKLSDWNRIKAEMDAQRAVLRDAQRPMPRGEDDGVV